MSATVTYTFAGFTLRPATEADLELAFQWTHADPAHRGVIAPGFWLEQGVGVDSYLLEDAEGPVFFFKLQRAVRLFIQFAPSIDASRTRNALIKGMQWLELGLAAVGVLEVIFDSASPLLRRMVTGRLGFNPKPETLSRIVQPPFTGFGQVDLSNGAQPGSEARIEALPTTLQAGG